MRFYIAIIHKDDDSDFGVSFPDFPGCVSAGSTLAEAVDSARDALEGHAGLMADEGMPIPEPSSMDAIMADPDNRGGTPALVPLAPIASKRAVRVSVTFPEDTLQVIDQFAEAHGFTRSGFLATAAKKAMEAA